MKPIETNFQEFNNSTPEKLTEFEIRKISNYFEINTNLSTNNLYYIDFFNKDRKYSYRTCTKKVNDDYFLIEITKLSITNYVSYNFKSLYYKCDQLNNLINFLYNIDIYVDDISIIDNKMLLNRIDNKIFVNRILNSKDYYLEDLDLIKSLFKKGYNLNYKVNNYLKYFGINVFLFLVKNNILFDQITIDYSKKYKKIPDIDIVLDIVIKKFQSYITKQFIQKLNIDFLSIYEKMNKREIDNSLLDFMPNKDIIDNLLNSKLEINSDYKYNLMKRTNREELELLFEESPFYNKYKEMISKLGDVYETRNGDLYYKFNKKSIVSKYNRWQLTDKSFEIYVNSNYLELNKKSYKYDVETLLHKYEYDQLYDTPFITSIMDVNELLSDKYVIEGLGIDEEEQEYFNYSYNKRIDDYLLDSLIEFLEREYKYRNVFYWTDGSSELILELSDSIYDAWKKSLKEYYDDIIYDLISEYNKFSECCVDYSNDQKINLFSVLLYLDINTNSDYLISLDVYIKKYDFINTYFFHSIN